MAENKKIRNPHENHRKRMRERARNSGLESFAEHEALEYLLFFAIPRKDTNELAHRLIDRFGGFCRVLEASVEELCEVEGIGPASAELIHAVAEFRRYYDLKSRKEGVSLKSVENCIQYVLPMFTGKKEETAYLILMDDKFFPIKTLKIGSGTPNRVRIDMLQMVRAAAKVDATCAIMAHNHPTGIPLPSASDLEVTNNVKLNLANVGVELIDHIIVAGGEACSLRSLNCMP